MNDYDVAFGMKVRARRELVRVQRSYRHPAYDDNHPLREWFVCDGRAIIGRARLRGTTPWSGMPYRPTHGRERDMVGRWAMPPAFLADEKYTNRRWFACDDASGEVALFVKDVNITDGNVDLGYEAATAYTATRSTKAALLIDADGIRFYALYADLEPA